MSSVGLVVITSEASDGDMRDEIDYEGPVKVGQVDLKRWKN